MPTYPTGTEVSKYFLHDLDRDEQRIPFVRYRHGDRMEGVVVSHGLTITSGPGVQEVIGWKYRVRFENCDLWRTEIFHEMSEKELESCLHKNCPYHLCQGHFGDVVEILRQEEDDDDDDEEERSKDYTAYQIDWEAFSMDLDRVPHMAEVLFGLEDYGIEISIFFLALIMPNRPVSVIQKIMRKWPRPYECEHYPNWLAIALDVAEKTEKDGAASLFDFDEEILRLILKKTNDVSTTRQISSSALAPIHNFILSDSGGHFSLAKMVLEECDDAVALVLADHYRGRRDVPQEVLKYALSCSKKRNSKGAPVRILDCFYNNKFRHIWDITGFSLMEELFMFIDSKKRPLFDRLLKNYVTTSTNSRNLVANVSLTNMVLYTLEDMSTRSRVSNRVAHLSCWTKFVAAHQEIKTLTNHRQTVLVMSPLLYAISLGFPWNPVLRDLVAAGPSALESVDFVELLPPFLMAATVECTSIMCAARGVTASCCEDEDADRAIVENTFELLKANPAMLASASEKGNAEAARKSLKTRKKETKAINGKRKFVQSAFSFQPITSNVK
jgi:hypothetical protein